jgi:hypothetical protein
VEFARIEADETGIRRLRARIAVRDDGCTLRVERVENVARTVWETGRPKRVRIDLPVLALPIRPSTFASGCKMTAMSSVWSWNTFSPARTAELNPGAVTVTVYVSGEMLTIEKNPFASVTVL